MKVIEKGRKQEGWAKEYLCTGYGNKDGGCGAYLLVEENDLFQTRRHSYGDTDPTYFVTFQCCECNVLTDIEDTPFRGEELPTLDRHGVRFRDSKENK